MSDGVLTPAQSVLGSIQGLLVVNPNLPPSAIVGISCGILIVLFLIQPLGTTKLASSFAPIVIIWLAFNGAFGVYNLVMFDHSVLKAFSPYYAGAYLVRNGESGWRSLGGILLAFTGVEALFADLGAFSRQAITLSWMCFAFPMLLLAYNGQAAYISVNPAAWSNPFFNCVPPGMFYPSLVVAILATIVASQAMITATFQLLSQLMKLSYMFQLKTVHTSKIFHGQIYIPSANWLLMIGTVVVTAVYNNTTSLGNAYGVCVILVTFITTCMVALVAVVVWKFNPILVFVVWLPLAALDGAYLSSALTKVPQGAWFTLVLAVILASVFILWRFGKENQWIAEAGDRFKVTHLVNTMKDGSMQLTSSFGGKSITTVGGFGIFFDKTGDLTPTVFIQFVSKLVAIPEVMIFLNLRSLSKPSVPADDRYTVTRMPLPNCYRLVIRHGYTDEVLTNRLGELVRSVQPPPTTPITNNHRCTHKSASSSFTTPLVPARPRPTTLLNPQPHLPPAELPDPLLAQSLPAFPYLIVPTENKFSTLLVRNT
jgi:KUP system potassium uptake protein